MAKNQKIPSEIKTIGALIAKLEGALSVEADKNSNMPSGKISFDEKYSDYEIFIDDFNSLGLKKAAEFLADAARRRLIQGIYETASYQKVSGSKMVDIGHGHIGNEIIYKTVSAYKFIVRPEDLHDLEVIIEQQVALQNKNLDAAKLQEQKGQIKASFLKAASPKAIALIFGLKSNLSERTPRELTSESEIAIQISRNFDENENLFSEVDTISSILADDKILTNEDRVLIAREAAIKFIEARKLAPTMAEMKLKI